MTRVIFSTNLDEPRFDVDDANKAIEQTPLSRVPCVGERVCFPFQRDGESYTFELEVVAVTWTPSNARVRVELHTPSWQRSMSIRDWSRWFAAHRHGKTS